MSYIPEPITRIDKYLAYIAGNMDVALPDYPITRKEHYLAAWAEKSGFEDVDVTGEPPLTLENAIGKPLKGLKIYGKSKQVTTTGAQLLDQTKATVDGWNIKYDIPLEKSKTYTFTNGEKAANFIGLFGVNPGEKDELLSNEYLSPKESYTFTCAKDYATILLGGSDGKTVLDGRYMLNAGSTPLPWEPYTGGKPSPSPDYPQEIESVGQGKTIGINVRGKNLLNPLRFFSGRTHNGITWTVKNNGKIVCEGTASEDSFMGAAIPYPDARWLKIPAGRYVLSGSGELVMVYINIVSLNGDKKGSYYCQYNSSIKCVFTEDVYISLQAMVRSGKTAAETVCPQFESGDTATPYEPYHEAQSMDISTPNGLPGIPVSSDGNYTDTDGQQWICDEIDFGRGVYVQNIKVSKSLNKLGWLTWGVNKGANGITGFFTYDIDIPKIDNAISNIAIYNGDIYGGKKAGICASVIKPTSMTPYMILCVRNDTISDISSDNAAIQSFKEMLAETDAYMMYVLAHPIKTPLTADQIAAYKQLHTYKGTTIIDNDAGAYMSVKYEKMK